MTEHGGINVGDKFSSFSALNTRIRQYEVQNNIEFYKRDSRTIESARKRGIKRELSEDLQFYQIRYSCINGGKEHNSKTNGERPKQSSFRKGCPAYFSVGVSEDGKFLVVKSIEDHHNHVISKVTNDESLSDLKMPTKQKRKGRPKGSQQTVIGLPKKRGKNKLIPFFKRTVNEKEREILSWLVSVDSVMKASGGTLLDEEDLVGLSEDSLPYRCLDDYVDLTIVQKNFTSSAWLFILSIVKEKQQKGGYILCTYCNVFITTENDDAVECDFCLLWWHMSCIKLKCKPKVKHWYCKSCR